MSEVDYGNVDVAIEIMERAAANNAKFDMSHWQKPNRMNGEFQEPAKSEREIHNCGNSACFGGYIAASPEWQADPCRTIDPRMGFPILFLGDISLSECDAIAYWLGISIMDSFELCGVVATEENSIIENTVYNKPIPDIENTVYNKPIPDIEIPDVLEVLYRLKETGSIWTTKSKGGK